METWIVVIAVVAIGVVVSYANYQNAKPFRIESSTALQPQPALDALQARLARDGWALGFRDDSSLIMSADKRADLGTTAAIGCLSVWMGLLHAVSSQRTTTVQFDAAPNASGTIIITNGSRSGSGVLRYVATQLRELPKS